MISLWLIRKEYDENTKSTTESELVGFSEYLPFDLQFKMIMHYQGYTITKNIGYQDNQAAIKMEKNGRTSCTGNSRHIDIRYFFVKDRVDKGELDIEYCHTTRMLADFFTKPLQGAQFNLLRDIIMGYKHVSELSRIDPVHEERVDVHASTESVSNTDTQADKDMSKSANDDKDIVSGNAPSIE